VGLGKTAMFIAHCLHCDAAPGSKSNGIDGGLKGGSGGGRNGIAAVRQRTAYPAGAPAHLACLCESDQPSKANVAALASDLARRAAVASSASAASPGGQVGRGPVSSSSAATLPATPAVAQRQAQAQLTATRALTVVCGSCGDEHHASCVGADALGLACWICIRCENAVGVTQHQVAVAAAAASGSSAVSSTSAVQIALHEGTGLVPGGNVVVRAALCKVF
jgi:hypothetical protein